jgi:hypothetical protein
MFNFAQIRLRKENTVRRVGEVRHDLHAHCHPRALRSGGWRNRGHCYVGRGRAGLAPMATATTGKLRPPQREAGPGDALSLNLLALT